MCPEIVQTPPFYHYVVDWVNKKMFCLIDQKKVIRVGGQVNRMNMEDRALSENGKLLTGCLVYIRTMDENEIALAD